MRAAHAAYTKPKRGSEDTQHAEAEYAELQELDKSYGSSSKYCRRRKSNWSSPAPSTERSTPGTSSELLQGRAVKQGQVLMSVADPTGNWELEVHMPEERIGHVALARKDIQPELPVRFYPGHQSGRRARGRGQGGPGHAEVRPEEGNTVLVRVEFDKSQLRPTDMRPGAAVTAKINCGRVPIGYKYFHDVIGFIQAKILFKL